MPILDKKKDNKVIIYDFTSGRKNCRGCDREDERSWESMKGKTFEKKAA